MRWFSGGRVVAIQIDTAPTRSLAPVESRASPSGRKTIRELAEEIAELTLTSNCGLTSLTRNTSVPRNTIQRAQLPLFAHVAPSLDGQRVTLALLRTASERASWSDADSSFAAADSRLLLISAVKFGNAIAMTIANTMIVTIISISEKPSCTRNVGPRIQVIRQPPQAAKYMGAPYPRLAPATNA
ncbi:hypothetical protein AO826_09090 [Xanthomonas phaseoli pv. manihotis]|nr:hypothetical protein AO826_09090 [Xanthomonas phaseoli pv. manihotis]